MDYKDVSDEAPHRRTLMSHDEYIGSCLAAGAQPSRLFGAPGLQLHHFTVDAMHAADLGVFADFAGSVLHIEVSSKQLYRNREEGVASVNGELAIYYRARPGLTRATPLHLSQLTSQSGYPFLRAKAAECRHLLPYVRDVAHRHRHGDQSRAPLVFRGDMAGRSAAHLELVTSAADALVRYLDSLRWDRGQPFDPDECRSGLLGFLQAYTALHDLWRDGITVPEAGKTPFRMRPKFHMLHHLALDQLSYFGNPAAHWCYGDEDFCGRHQDPGIPHTPPAHDPAAHG